MSISVACLKCFLLFCMELIAGVGAVPIDFRLIYEHTLSHRLALMFVEL
jgi:hypothetical protein